jgi:hypothetical protein
MVAPAACHDGPLLGPQRASNPNRLERATRCDPRRLKCAVGCSPSVGTWLLWLFREYCGTSSRSSFVFAGFRVATLVHAICDRERSHLVEPKARDCRAGRTTGDLVNTLGRCFRYTLQCCDKVNSRALRTVDTCMCCHIRNNGHCHSNTESGTDCMGFERLATQVRPRPSYWNSPRPSVP